MAAYVEDESDVPPQLLQDALAAQTRRALVHPVFSGSAVTGAGVEALLAGITELLPAAAGDPDGPVSATVFKIERGANGEKIAYVRMFSGTIHVRERLHFGRGLEDKVTAIAVFEQGPPSSVRPSPRARSQSSGGSPRSRSATGSARPHRPWRLVSSRRRRSSRSSSPERPDDGAQLRDRARAARRAGSADRRPPGRRAAGSSPSRSTARCRRR